MDGTLPPLATLGARQFHLAVKRLADSISYGTDRSPFIGSGLEYLQSRPYVPGDPVKAIDWRVTARTRTVHVKQYETTRRMPAMLLVDTSASMTVSSGPRSKYELAVLLAGGLAVACLERTSPVGLVGVGQRRLRVEPSLSKDHLLQWLERLRHYTFDEPTSLAARIDELGRTLPQRTLVLVLSDLHDPQAVPALKRLHARHDLAVIELRDPAERGLAGAGFVRAREAETGRAVISRRVASPSADEARSAELRQSGIDHLQIDTDRSYLDRLRHFLATRHLLGRGARA